jgi:radical SAM protein with 4Fe4S-binding SPASM domain
MQPSEWGDKLSSDIAERPDFYFQRQEVPRLEQDLDEYQNELWQIQQDLRDAQKNNLWYRTVSKTSCQYCSYFDLCSGGQPLSKVAPDGFEFVSDCHPELERTNERSAPETPAAETVPATNRQESYW